MSLSRNMVGFPCNEAGLVDTFIGTAYDVVKGVYDNLDEIVNAGETATESAVAAAASAAAALLSAQNADLSEADAEQASDDALNARDSAEAYAISTLAVGAEVHAALLEASLPPDIEYWDASLYFPTATLGPSNRLAELYPRINLTRPVLGNCFVRRATPDTENLVLLLKPTSGLDWTATCIIPAGQREGFFVSGDVLPINSTQGFYITPSPLPSVAITGLSITLRFEIQPEQAVTTLSVPQPLPVDTIVTFGQHADEFKPSFNIRKLSTGGTVNAADTGANIATYLDASTSRDGASIIYVKDDSDVICADMRTGLTKFSLVDALIRKGASFSKDADRFVTAEYRAGVWWAVEYNIPSLTVYHETNLSLLGATSLNSIKYSPNDRYIMVGHASGHVLLNALTWIPQIVTTPPTGNVLDVDMTVSIYAVLSRKVDDFDVHITTNGQLMTDTGLVDWNEITCTAFNWDAELPSPYPYFVVAGQTSVGWQVVPYAADATTYQEMSWKINFGERIVGVAFSEAALIDEEMKESTYGRAIAVFGEHGYKIYDLQTGIEVASRSITTYTNVTGGFWKSVKGVY